jgi:hypothetical protein
VVSTFAAGQTSTYATKVCVSTTATATSYEHTT